MSLKSPSLFDVKQLYQEFMDPIDKAMPKKRSTKKPKTFDIKPEVIIFFI